MFVLTPGNLTNDQFMLKTFLRHRSYIIIDYESAMGDATLPWFRNTLTSFLVNDLTYLKVPIPLGGVQSYSRSRAKARAIGIR